MNRVSFVFRLEICPDATAASLGFRGTLVYRPEKQESLLCRWIKAKVDDWILGFDCKLISTNLSLWVRKGVTSRRRRKNTKLSAPSLEAEAKPNPEQIELELRTKAFEAAVKSCDIENRFGATPRGQGGKALWRKRLMS